MNLKPYPSYKNSGVEWIGEIPEGWEVVKLRWLSSRYSGGTPDRNNISFWEDGTIPWVNSGAVNQGNITHPSEYITVQGFQNSSAKWIPEDSLVIALAGQGKTKGMVAHVKIKTTCNQSMAAIIPNLHAQSRFLYWYLSAQYEKIRGLVGDDLRDGLNLDIIGGIPCPKPSIPDQSAIASFLDTHTARIDDLLAKNRRLIELLREKRAALINHVVTKGLDPKAKMKDSSVKWIGEIPEGWVVHKLKHLTIKINSGITPTGGAKIYVEEGIPILRSQNVHFDGLRLNDVAFITEEIHNEMSNSKLKENDVLLNITGASIGRCTYFSSEYKKANVNQHVCIIRPKNVHPQIINYCLMSKVGQEQIFSNEMGTSREGLNYQQIGDFTFPLPTEREQDAIVAYLNHYNARINKTILAVERKIELLEEYRKSLIHHVVTGKVDVRGVEA